MTDKQIVEYVKRIITNNLAENDCYIEVAAIGFDNNNEILLGHIKALISVFEKAKEILIKESDKNE